MLCILAPSVSRWAAYLHCKIAEISLQKDCGCDAIITQHLPNTNDHEAPLQLVQKAFSDWQFEEKASIQTILLLPVKSNFNRPINNTHLPKDLVQSIFHPPVC